MVYGLCETFEITIKSILDERSQPQSNVATGKEPVKEDCKDVRYSISLMLNKQAFFG